MQKSSIYILFYGTAIGCASILYFVSLLLHLPYLVCIALVATALFFLFQWFNDIQTLSSVAKSNIPFYIMLAAVLILINGTYETATKYGAWDAWAIWELHAKYLADPAYWQNMFLNKEHAHADYPLALPAALAFLYRAVSPQYYYLITYTFHFAVMLFIPVLIFLQTYKRGLVLSGIVLLYIVTRENYLVQGTYLMADNILAFFFLCAIISADNSDKDPKMAAVCTMMLGCCFWTKNEGLVLTLLFLSCYLRPLFAKPNLRYSIAGITIPVIALLVFKLLYAPPNDIVSQNNGIMAKLTEARRYSVVWQSFKNSISTFYYLPACGVALAVLISLTKRKAIPKGITLILLCCLAYFMVYVITPLDQEWHLSTSIDRVLHQLMPATMYMLVMYFSGGSVIRFRGGFASNTSSLP